VAALDTDLVTDFEAEAGRLRGELLAHCYRMLGNRSDAEDAVQETLLRAWRGWSGFEGRSSVRTWLYTVATRVCLDAARSRGARPHETPLDPAALPASVAPFEGRDDDLRLAFIVALQRLPPRQRAVLLLRDVLGYTAAEASAILEMSIPAVKSSLQRARASAGGATAPDDVIEPRHPAARRMLGVYIDAFERGDVGALIEVLRADAVLTIAPNGGAFEGLAACAPVLRDAVGAGVWRLRDVVLNGQPAALAHVDGSPYGAAVLDIRRDGIAAVTVFADPALAVQADS
jgi:RNA polymerase sigma-70 factor (ECF subfamily)